MMFEEEVWEKIICIIWLQGLQINFLNNEQMNKAASALMILSDCVCEQNTSTQPPSLFLFNQGAKWGVRLPF